MSLPRGTAPPFREQALELRREDGFEDPGDSHDGRDQECRPWD